ncbi:hypothetical protein [Mumia zhuanghuii]|uniref:Uncharacterized protein n=1 Tax=Mumia zhuanghuii TaxID=2585211 RepID=A0A5C4N5V5_9ACTN|nr:hypothetical protein [Mumia zhuanghuii]TNC51749.1 hypothetical protein FHE65_01180 [Mumia zhuanghuii]TNC52139.1 hypothetical protein FHE65_00750 [Mumia zhuanghuii]
MSASGSLFFGVLPLVVMMSVFFGVAAALQKSLPRAVRRAFGIATAAMAVAAAGAVAAWFFPSVSGMSRDADLVGYEEAFVQYVVGTLALGALLFVAALTALAAVTFELLTSPRRR